LKNRIYPDNERIPVDHDQFRQCHECGSIVPVYEIEKEATIKDVVETVDNPFENKFHLETIPKRNSPAGKRASAKRRRNKIKLDDDPEIDALLRAYGENVRLIK
jgi:hypothetical protein